MKPSGGESPEGVTAVAVILIAAHLASPGLVFQMPSSESQRLLAR